MAEVVTFVNYLPPARFDLLPWTEVRIQEATAEDGTFAQIDVVALAPLDADPSQPQLRSFTTQLGTAIGYWYRVVFADADGDVSQPSTPVQNVAGGAPSTAVYATISDLQRVLQKPSPTSMESDAMLRVLDTAAREIDWELSITASNPPPAQGTREYALISEVNLARAHELWNAEFRPSGLLTAGADTIPLLSAQDSWKRHALRLLPLKTEFGFA